MPTRTGYLERRCWRSMNERLPPVSSQNVAIRSRNNGTASFGVPVKSLQVGIPPVLRGELRLPHRRRKCTHPLLLGKQRRAQQATVIRPLFCLQLSQTLISTPPYQRGAAQPKKGRGRPAPLNRVIGIGPLVDFAFELLLGDL